MRIMVINPNTNQAMTAAIDAAARRYLDPRTQVATVTNTSGPLSIEGFFDEVLSAPGVLEYLVAEEENYDAFVIACYSSHPAVTAGKEAIRKPVVGILEASLLVASLVSQRFAIVTTSPRWEPLLAEGVRQIGLESRCAAIKSSGLAVLDLAEKSQAEIEDILFDVSRQTITEYGAEAICLGCAGMAGLAEKLERQLRAPVIDPICAAVKLVEALVYQNLTTSKAGAYRPVEPRQATNVAAVFKKVYQA